MGTFPKLDTPTYTLRLPISKTEIVFRPYLTKEEKLLLMAVESKDPKTVVDSIRQIAINCVISPKDLNIDNLPMVDLEYLFLHLRAKSKGELLDAKFSCKAVVPKDEDPDAICGNIITLAVRIDELKVKIPEGYNDVIPITETIGVKMRLPRYKDSARVSMGAVDSTSSSSPARQAFDLIKASIESVYDNDQVFPVTSENIDELDTFIESLTSEQFAKIEKFLETSPSIDYMFDVKCSKCGYDHHIAYKDIASFF
jgi:hypothetical protein